MPQAVLPPPEPVRLVIHTRSGAARPQVSGGRADRGFRSPQPLAAWLGRLARRLRLPAWLRTPLPTAEPPPGAALRVVIANLDETRVFTCDALGHGSVIPLPPGTYHVTARTGSAEMRYTLTLDGKEAVVLDLAPWLTRATP
jgi:hypothetical protein